MTDHPDLADWEAPDEDVTEGLADTVVHGAGLSGLGWGLAQAITLASYLVLARLVSPSEFGEMTAASILISIGFLFTESGMNSALVQRTDRLEEAANTALVSTFLGGIGLSLLGVAAAPLVGLAFQDGHIGVLSAALAPLLFCRTITVVPDSLLQRRFSFVRRTIIAPGAAIAFGAGAIIATAAGLGVWGLVVGQYVSAVVDVALAWLLSRWRPKPQLASFAMWRELVGFGRHVIAAGIIQRSTEQLDRFLLGRFSGTSVLGQYGYAYRLASTPYMAVLVVGGWVLFPAFARISVDRGRFRAAFLRSLFWIGALGFPLGLILFPLGEPLAVLLFGETWRPAGHATMFLCLFPAANAVFTVALEALKGDGRPEFFVRIYAVLAVLTTVLMLSLLPIGLDGIAGALSLASVGGAAYALYVFHGVHPIGWPLLLGRIWPAALAAALMAAALYPLEHLLVQSDQRALALGLALLLVEAVIGAALYLALLATFARGSFEELTAMARTLASKLTASMRRRATDGGRA